MPAHMIYTYRQGDLVVSDALDIDLVGVVVVIPQNVCKLFIPGWWLNDAAY